MTSPMRRSLLRLAALAVGGVPLASMRAQPMLEDLDTPFVITPSNVVTSMLDLAGVRAGDRLLDLGSGDGRIVLAAAQRGATAVGIEIDANLVERSRESARRLKLQDRATFVTQDLFQMRYDGYDVITLYLLPDVNRRLAPHFLALPAGTRIVSHDYGLGDWPADKSIVVDAPDKPVNVEKKSTIHFWRVPARVEGRWRGEAGGAPIVVDIRQRYQAIAGSVRMNDREYRFDERRVDGDRATLALAAPRAPDIVVELQAVADRLDAVVRERDRAPVAVSLRR